MKTYLLIFLSPLWVVFGYAQSVHLFQTVENSGLDSNSWLSQRVIPPETDNLGWVINYNAIMATCHIPQNIQRYQREEYLILPSEMAAGGFLSGFSINTIGFMAGMAGNGTQTGTLNIWLKNSSDLTYTLGSVWTTTDFTLVSSNPAFIVPTSGFYTIPFVNGSPFTYTGGSLYVAWEFVNPAGPIGTTKLYPLVNTGTSLLSYLNNSPIWK